MVPRAAPFVISEGKIGVLKSLFGHLVLRPCLGALQVVGLALVVEAVPGVKEIANVLGLFLLLAFNLVLGHGLGSIFVVIRKLALFLGIVGFGFLRLFGPD